MANNSKGTKGTQGTRRVRSINERYGARFNRLRKYDKARVLHTLALHFLATSEQLRKAKDSDAEVQATLRGYSLTFVQLADLVDKAANLLPFEGKNPCFGRGTLAREDVCSTVQVVKARRQYFKAISQDVPANVAGILSQVNVLLNEKGA